MSSLLWAMARACAAKSRYGIPGANPRYANGRGDGRRGAGGTACSKSSATSTGAMATIYEKANGPGVTRARASELSRSDLANVLRLQPLWTLGDVELDVVTLGEAAEALRLDRCEVDEHVWTRLLRDKPKAFRVVEPLHLTLSHTVKTSAQWGTAPDWNDPRHRGVGRAQTKIRETFGPRGAQTAVDGATYA